ncbi:hypothetical protein C6I20_01140 [Aeromicrobium sp. A1-2]|uniref:lipocalin-like domain-containing protein n=1 Tax=Aeromicrobium sp. A1-2 TaxID=2107713 RepID=UPI000E49E712|nr:lipocalin-like domain-containing protein [Aeromicrobium sp. A1-2]AXT83935.1 hypothetical protein C6I20_01140 [Aeromicrobium sp. A1-2]
MSPTIVEGWNGPGSKDAVLTRVTPADNALHVSTSKKAFEHWYFDARLDSGHTVIAFFTKRRPEERASCDPSVEILIYGPDGSRRQIRKSYPKDQATFSAQRADVRIGANTAVQDTGEDDLPVFRIHLAEEDVAFDLTFRNELPSWMPGRGDTFYGGTDHFGWCVGGPREQVTGSITIAGETTVVTGIGYADHNWGVGDMKRIIDRWHWGRLYLDDYSLIFATVLTQKRLGRHMSRPMMLAKGDEIVLSTGEVELTEGPLVFHPAANRTYPTWIRLQVPGRVDLRLDVQLIIDAQDLLDEVPVARSRMVKPIVHALVGRPGYFRFDSTYTLTVVEDGETITRTGSTLHEMVALS